MAPSVVDKQATLPVATALPGLICRLSTASIMADVAMTPQNATSFRAGLRTVLWAIVPVEVADEVLAAAVRMVVEAAGTDAAEDEVVAEGTHQPTPPSSPTFPTATALSLSAHTQP